MLVLHYELRSRRVRFAVELLARQLRLLLHALALSALLGHLRLRCRNGTLCRSQLRFRRTVGSLHLPELAIELGLLQLGGKLHGAQLTS